DDRRDHQGVDPHGRVHPRDRAHARPHDRRRAGPGARCRSDDARRTRRVMAEQHGNSARAVLAALFANLGIAVMKFVAFLVTGSSAIVPESIHSVADTGNQSLLLLGRKRSDRPADDRHPFGYAPVQYFYSFIVAFVLFTLGGLFSVYEGIDKLRHPHQVEDLWIAIVVLAGAAMMEGFSFRTAVREANHVRAPGESWRSFIHHTKSPDLPVVVLEDFAALIGLGLA